MKEHRIHSIAAMEVTMRITRLSTLSLAILLYGCGNSESALGPQAAGEGLVATAQGGEPGRRIFLRDLCGGTTWAPFGGCVINGPVERPEWLARVLATGSHPLWANSPVQTSVQEGTTLEIVNVGGRPHSFTRVANFGGGALALLNTREDTAIPAPECLQAFESIAGGGASTLHTFTGLGEQKYQCCFHPWMRSTVNVTAAHGQ
jgi:plastocyanin